MLQVKINRSINYYILTSKSALDIVFHFCRKLEIHSVAWLECVSQTISHCLSYYFQKVIFSTPTFGFKTELIVVYEY